MLFNSLVAKVRFIIELLDLLYVEISDSFKSSKLYFSSQLTNSVALIELVIFEFHGSSVVGMMEGILFRRWPRVMINRFFVPTDMKKGRTSKPKSSDLRADRPVVTKDSL